ncbi:MAG: prenyltransferase [Deltaproteobacteria bacterium]|jgi:1,4-dihydroxy-2-naphthoate octaprenyltransferase|nr:prenyltransferase [Deltaproteobacteria bacterium]
MTDVAAGIWRLADPKISLASMASMFLGAAAAASDGPLAPGWLALTVVGIFCIEVAKNASGEVVDYDSGADLAIADEDRSPFSGGKRVLVDGLLTKPQTMAVAAVSYALGIAAGLVIVILRDPHVLWLGVLGVACAYGYHAPPARLAYRGFGELAVALCYGPLICCGTYLVQRGHVSGEAVAVSLPLGLAVAGFLWINEFPDYRADLATHKRTLVVRLGRRRASQAFALLMGVVFGGLALQPLWGVSTGVWLGALGLPPAITASRTLLAHPETTTLIVPAQARTLQAFVLLAFGAGVGLMLF